MGQKHRQEYLYDVVELLPSHSSLVLDAGCGVGALSNVIRQYNPLTRVIGLDLSMYMLTHQLKEIDGFNVQLLQAVMPRFPFRAGSIDAVVAVQSMSEVLCFSGDDILSETLAAISRILRHDGIFVVMDHQSPGEGALEINLKQQVFQQLERFQKSFKYRPFNFKILDDGWIRIPMRDLYEFTTKAWAFDTPLEEEEMQETHTPYTGEEFANVLRGHGFSIDLVTGVVPFESYLKRYKIRIRPKQGLPQRFFIVKATKK